MIRTGFRSAWAAAAPALCLIAGCGGHPDRVPVVRTSGKLEWPGQSVLGLMIVLHPVDPAAPKLPAQPTGVVQPDGTFAIAVYEMSDGAPVGEYVVTIREAPLPDDRPRPKLPPAKYLDPKTSPLRVKIQKKSVNELDPLTITG